MGGNITGLSLYDALVGSDSGGGDGDGYDDTGFAPSIIRAGANIGDISVAFNVGGVQILALTGDIGNISIGGSMLPGTVDSYGEMLVANIVRAGGDIGNIAVGADLFGTEVQSLGGSIGNVDVGDELVDTSITANENVGDITVTNRISNVVVKAETGDIGTVMSATENIYGTFVAGDALEGVIALQRTILDGTVIKAISSIGEVKAGGYIEDGVFIYSQGTIGKVEGRVVGFDDAADDESTIITTEVEEDNDGIADENDLVVFDNDGIFDFSNDLMGFEDSDGDNIVMISPVIQQYIAEVDSNLLADGVIDASEAQAIIEWAGGVMPDFSELDPSDMDDAGILIFTDLFQNLFKEVVIIDVDDVIDVDNIVEVVTVVPADNQVLTIKAAGDVAIAIGEVKAIQDITTDVKIEAVFGGIGTITAGQVLGAEADSERAYIFAQTEIGALYGGAGIENLDILVPSPDSVDFSRIFDGIDNDLDDVIDEPDEFVTGTGGVGVDGGITSGTDIVDVTIETGGSIGNTRAMTGELSNVVYDAVGNIASIFAKEDIQGTFKAAIGIIGDAVDIGDPENPNDDHIDGFVWSGVGDINAEFVAGLGAGTIKAPFGNVSGSLITGRIFEGQEGQIVESPNADDNDFDVSYSSAVLEQFTNKITLDTNRDTVPQDLPEGFTFLDGDDPDLLPDGDVLQFTNSEGATQTISVVGSSADVEVTLSVLFGRVTSAEVSGNGTLKFSSTDDVVNAAAADVGLMTVNLGASSKLAVGSIFVDGDFGGFVNMQAKSKIGNITATDDIGLLQGGTIQNIKSEQGSIGEIKALYDGVKNITAYEDIDYIFAQKTVQNVKAGDYIGEIVAMKSVKIVNAADIGLISGNDMGTISNITVLGDIDLIEGRTVQKVVAGGSLNVVAHSKASMITAGVGGTVQVGEGFSKISPNIEVTVRP